MKATSLSCSSATRTSLVYDKHVAARPPPYCLQLHVWRTSNPPKRTKTVSWALPTYSLRDSEYAQLNVAAHSRRLTAAGHSLRTFPPADIQGRSARLYHQSTLRMDSHPSLRLRSRSIHALLLVVYSSHRLRTRSSPPIRFISARMLRRRCLDLVQLPGSPMRRRRPSVGNCQLVAGRGQSTTL